MTNCAPKYPVKFGYVDKDLVREEEYYKEHERMHQADHVEMDWISEEHMEAFYVNFDVEFYSHRLGHLCPYYAVYQVKRNERSVANTTRCRKCKHVFSAKEKHYIYYRLKHKLFEKYKGNTKAMLYDDVDVFPIQRMRFDNFQYRTKSYCGKCAKQSYVLKDSFSDI